MIIAFLLVKGSNLVHFLIGQCKIKQIVIVLDVRRILRSGDHNIACLNMPAQDDLCIALAVFPGQFRKQWFLQQPCIAMS